MTGPVDNTRNVNNGAYVVKNDAEVKLQGKKADNGSIFGAEKFTSTVSASGTASLPLINETYENGILTQTETVEIPYTLSVEVPYEYESDYSTMGLQIGNTTKQLDQKNTSDNIVDRFKQLDKDGDLKVSADEFIKDFIQDCLENGYGANPGQNFADIIAGKYAEFKRFAGEDVSMNIDEFREMVLAQMPGVETGHTQQMPALPEE